MSGSGEVRGRAYKCVLYVSNARSAVKRNGETIKMHSFVNDSFSVKEKRELLAELITQRTVERWGNHLHEELANAGLALLRHFLPTNKNAKASCSREAQARCWHSK